MDATDQCEHEWADVGHWQCVLEIPIIKPNGAIHSNDNTKVAAKDREGK